jgi:hypothetical protein
MTLTPASTHIMDFSAGKIAGDAGWQFHIAPDPGLWL